MFLFLLKKSLEGHAARFIKDIDFFFVRDWRIAGNRIKSPTHPSVIANAVNNPKLWRDWRLLTISTLKPSVNIIEVVVEGLIK